MNDLPGKSDMPPAIDAGMPATSVAEHQEPYRWISKNANGPLSVTVADAHEALWDSLEHARQYLGAEKELTNEQFSDRRVLWPGEWHAAPVFTSKQLLTSFSQPHADAVQSEMTALREELDSANRSAETLHEVIARLKRERDVAVQQNAELSRLAGIAVPRLRESGSYTLATLFEGALKPTESGVIA